MSKTKFIIIGSILIIILVASFFFSYIAGKQEKISLFDPKSYNPSGLKALQLLMAKYHYQLIEVPGLPEKTDQTKLLLVFTSSMTDSVQVKLLRRWIRSGGIVIEFPLDKPLLSPAKKWRVINYQKDRLVDSPLARFKNLRYRIKKDNLYTLSNPTIGYYAVSQRFFIFSQNIGQGCLITWSDPDGLVNRNLVNAPDNAVIFLMVLQELASSGKIGMLDLRYLPVISSQSIFSQIFNRYAVASLLIFACIIFTIWKLSTRFGRPQPLSLTRSRSYDEFVISLAGLFQQASAQTMVLENISSALKHTISDITGYSYLTPIRDQLNRLEELTGKNYQEIADLCENVSQVTSSKNKGSFLDIAIKLDNYRRELLTWKKSIFSSPK